MRTSTVRRFPLLLALVALIGFVLGTSWRAEARRRGGKAPAAASTDDCKKDTDCVMVADDCCSCNQGGKQRAIPKKQKDSYEKERKKRCSDTACTEMVSSDPTCSQKAFCAAGICELGDAPADSAP